MADRVALLATLDTKQVQVDRLAEECRAAGLAPVVIDISTATDVTGAGDVTRAALLEEAGLTAAEFVGLEKVDRMAVVADAAGRVLNRMVRESRVRGAIGLGGGNGTWLSARAFGTLPIGIPKFIVSTVAHRSGRYATAPDVVFVPSQVDIAGMNYILAGVLAGCARACAALIEVGNQPHSGGPVVAMTMFGVTTTGGDAARERLEAAGFDVAVFHANGVGGRTMEEFAAQGRFVGVLDWTTTEVVDLVVGGQCSAGEARLDAAGALGIPQVIVPGAMDIVNVGPRESIPEKFLARTLHQHTPAGVLMRSSPEENFESGAFIARKIMQARGPVRVVVPTEGFSSLGRPGEDFHDPTADRAFLDGLTGTGGHAIEIETIAANINDTEFAHAAADRLIEMLRASSDTTEG